jgi:hypothetical protein
VNAWIWPRRDVVPVVLTTVGANGKRLHCYCDLRPGHDASTTIELPEGAQAVTITRPRRQRVEFGQHRAPRWSARPARPTWRDDSSLVMWWRALLAERAGRRAVRSMRYPGRGGK